MGTLPMFPYTSTCPYPVSGLILNEESSLSFFSPVPNSVNKSFLILQRALIHNHLIKKNKTIYEKHLFQDSLHALMATLSVSNPFFIRCIKPNMEKVSIQDIHSVSQVPDSFSVT